MTGHYLLHLTGTQHDRDGARAALGLAGAAKAQLDAVFIGPDPADIVPFIGEGVPGSVVDELIKTANETADKAFAAASTVLAEEAAKAGLAKDAVKARYLRGPAIDTLARLVRLTDLTIFPYAVEMPAWSVQGRIEHVLLDVRRPVLVVRGKVSDKLPGKVVVLWDGKMEAATAILRARDLMAAASSVEVLHLRSGDKDTVSATYVVDHLAAYGIAAKANDVPPSGEPTGEALVAKVKALAPDLLVMGGYGHSRLRELVLGGATRQFLAAAPCPVFLAH